MEIAFGLFSLLGVVDLVHASEQYHFTVIAHPRQDRLQRRQIKVLALVHDQDRAGGKVPAPEKTEGLDVDLRREVLWVHPVFAVVAKALDRVVERGHIRLEFVFEPSLQEAEGLADFDGVPRVYDLLVFLLPEQVEGRRDRDEILSGAGGARDDDDGNVVRLNEAGGLLLLRIVFQTDSKD